MALCKLDSIIKKSRAFISKKKLVLDSDPQLNEFDAIDELNKTSYSIVDLLPQNSSALVRDSKIAFEILRRVYNIISLLADCLHKFYISKQYQYFDPHVGDMSCQIRAYACVVMSKKKDDDNTVIKRIRFFNSTLEKLTEILRVQINYKNKSHTIIELLRKYDCYFLIGWQEHFLYSTYFLTVFKKINAKGIYICNDELADFFGVSKTASKKMIYKYQSYLAKMSCEFIKTIALDLNINEKNSPNIISSTLFDNDGRIVYPCFFFSRILFMHMQKNRCAVLVILETIDHNDSRKDLILFNSGATQGRLLTRNNGPIKEDVCVVVVGTRIASLSISSLELLKCLNHYGLYAMLLMNMAAHPQFSGSKLISYANQLVPDTTTLVKAEKKIEREFLGFKKSAHKNRFCRDNPSLLLIKHIFMDSISHQINLHQNNNDYASVRESIDI